MLERVLEPEVMDSPEEARDYDAMDHREVNERFVTDFLAIHGPCRGGWIVDVGTGTARIPIALCRSDPGARVIASDLADQMLLLAARNVDAERLNDRIRVEKADAKRDDRPATEKYEALISNSIIHHIPEPGDVFRQMIASVAPGGTIFVRDLARPSSHDELERLVGLYTAGETEHAREMFAASLHAALTVEEVASLLSELGITSPNVQMTSDRHWTWTWKAPTR